ncbi:MAG: competence/damage-inducible protein A [Clostridium sp.]|nr:competence/damage-inducible protein A [Clostridium sp.]
MKTEIINIGTELLMGMIVNTNATYLAKECTKLGFGVYYQTVIGDNPERIREAITMAKSRADLIFITGGLGPTEDDITKETVAEVFGKPLQEDDTVKKEIRELFAKMGRKDIPNNNWKQAQVIEGAIVLHNQLGTAPGLILEADGITVVMLPGPPSELIPMVNEQVVPYLSKKQNSFFITKMVKLCGVSESSVAEKVEDLIVVQTNPTIAIYAKEGEVHIRVTASGASEAEAKKLVKPVIKELKGRFGVNVYTTDEDESLEACVVNLLNKHELSMVTAESCTGGMIAATIVNVPGASNVLKESFVTYSNKAKRKYLDVSKSTLKKYTEYSDKCAKEMAKGAAILHDSDVSIAVTGIAGPGGGTEEKPVGLVYIGCYVKDKVTVKEFHFHGDRSMIRTLSVVNGLDLLRRCLIAQYES